MEAADFWSVYEAVEDCTRRLKLTVRDGCAIQKVLWSSFDYMNGPELCFVWEPEVSTSRASPATLAADLGLGSGTGLTPASRSGNNSETASKDSKEDTSTSMTSSVSKAPSTNNYEEIDDVFNEELLTCAIAELDVCSVCSRMHSGVLCDSMITPSTISRNDSLNCGRIEAGGDSRLERNVHYLDEFMRSSDTSGGATKSETTLDGEEQDERAMGNSEEDGEGRRSRLMASFASASSELEESQSTATEELQEVARNEFFPNTPQDLSMLLRGGQGADGCETGVTLVEGGYTQGGARLTGYESYLEGGDRGLGTFEANMHKSESVHTQASSFSNVSEDGEGESENTIGNQEKQTEKTLESVENEDVEKRNGAEGEGDEPQQQAMFSSAGDSGITGTISTHSDLSASCVAVRSPSGGKPTDEGYAEPEVEDDGATRDGGSMRACETSMLFDDYAEDLDVLETMCGCGGVDETHADELSDERFIAKSVLAEQICSTQLPSNPLHHKLTLVPKRDLLAGSFMFPVAKRADGSRRAMCALSFLMQQSKLDWYMERQSTLESMVMDMLPRIKALHLVEDVHDVIFHLMGEVTKILKVIGAAERFPLHTGLDVVKLRRTYLMDQNLGDNTFLAKSITALLRSQARCVLVGDRKIDVAKMLNTLSLFVPEEWRWSCVKAYAHEFSPYFRLQAVHRSELGDVMRLGLESDWPLAVIDLDKRLVCISSAGSQIGKHFEMKWQYQRAKINAILYQQQTEENALCYQYGDNGGDKGDNGSQTGAGAANGMGLLGRTGGQSMKIEMRNCACESHVAEFLARLDILPMEQGIRIGFIRQFLLALENKARAFITYVQDASRPRDGDKEHASSCKWSLSAARKALDLYSEAWFGIVLAVADRLQPDLARFIYDSRSG